jgi:hypothetical protein
MLQPQPLCGRFGADPAGTAAGCRHLRCQRLPGAGAGLRRLSQLGLAQRPAPGGYGLGRLLRPLHDNRPADLLVSADVRQEKRLRQVQDDYGYGYSGYNRYGPGYGMYNTVPVVRTYEVQVVVVRINLFDARSGQPVWSASAETGSQGSLGERAEALRQAVQKAMAAYPPR